jgi:hypothetical protein
MAGWQLNDTVKGLESKQLLHIKVLSQHSSGGTEENHEKLGQNRVPAGIHTEHITNTSQGCYHFISLSGSWVVAVKCIVTKPWKLCPPPRAIIQYYMFTTSKK